MTHKDAEYEPEAEYEYECLDCGTTVTGTSHPGPCPDCGATLRNRHTPLE